MSLKPQLGLGTWTRIHLLSIKMKTIQEGSISSHVPGELLSQLYGSIAKTLHILPLLEGDSKSEKK